MKKSFLILIPLLIIFVTYGLWEISRSWSFQFFSPIIRQTNTNNKVVALTIDDGPNDQNINKILSLLDSLNLPATFFVTGKELEKNIKNGKRIVQAGHELGNHTYSHKRMVLKSYHFIKTELERTDSLIKASGFKGEIYFRPPGFKKLLMLPYYLKKNKRQTIGWNVAPDSQKEWRDEEKIYQNAIENIEPGSIILMHLCYPSREASLRALPRLVKTLRERGYQFIKLSEMLAL